MFRMNINMPERLRERLEIEAANTGENLSSLIRKACEHWLETHSLSSGLKAAKQGQPKWMYLWYRGGAYWIEDSSGHFVEKNGRQIMLTRRVTGSAGLQICAHCGEQFDAGTGSYIAPDAFLCIPCGEVLSSRTRALIVEQENQADLKAISEVLHESTAPWQEVKTRLRKSREVRRAG